MTRDEQGRPLVRIRVKERIDSSSERAVSKSHGPEKIILLVVGACLGLGLGYLLAGRLAALFRPSFGSVRADAPAARERGDAPAPAAPALEFDLPSEGE